MIKFQKKSNINSIYLDPLNVQMYTSSTNPFTIGVCFILKYLGSHLVEELKNGNGYANGVSTDAIRTIKVMRNKGSKKQPTVKVDFVIKSSGITVFNHTTKELILDSTIDRISFCTADGTYPKIFAYMARNSINETMECHAFSCNNSKIAFDVSLAVNQAFHVAKEELETKELQVNHDKNSNKPSESNIKKTEGISSHSSNLATNTNWVQFNE